MVRPDGSIATLKVEGLVPVLSPEVQDITGMCALPINIEDCKRSPASASSEKVSDQSDKGGKEAMVGVDPHPDGESEVGPPIGG